ncbi:PH domain-containing protein [Glutamicibacter sp. X7]
MEPLPNNFVAVDPRYLTVRTISWALASGLVLLVALIPALLGLLGAPIPGWLRLTLPLVVVLFALLELVLLRRRVAAIGYLERDEDLLVRYGLLVRNQRAVPYGRMQYVELKSGPLERRFGLCQLVLNTAASAATATILGVPAAEGEALRERLVAAGEARMM